MPRTLRASLGDYCYHVLNRGNARAQVFHDDGDYRAFVDLIGTACERLPMRVLAYCLMPNHFHLVLRPHGDGDLSRWMQWLLTAHVRRHHRRYGTTGHIWQGRFKAFPTQDDGHLLAVLRYVERNPLRAGLVPPVRGMALVEPAAGRFSLKAEVHRSWPEAGPGRMGPPGERGDDRGRVVGAEPLHRARGALRDRVLERASRRGAGPGVLAPPSGPAEEGRAGRSHLSLRGRRLGGPKNCPVDSLARTPENGAKVGLVAWGRRRGPSGSNESGIAPSSRPIGARPLMNLSNGHTDCSRWQPVFSRLLGAVESNGAHGQLVDIRDVLKRSIAPDRPLVMLCPHADDGAITAACLMQEYAVKRGLPVIEVLVFSGERNVDAPWMNDKKKVAMREHEFRLECDVIGTEAVCWELEAYRTAGYKPSSRDIDKIVHWFEEKKPGAVIVPPSTDAHQAHRMTRALAAIGLVGADLKDTLVLTGWTPWGALPRPNAFFPYDADAERTKQWAIHCHASQLMITDYFEFCTHLGRAYSALAREWTEGHNLGRSSKGDDHHVGIEMFQIERYTPDASTHGPIDPIQIALGILAGKIPAEAVAAL